MAPLLGECLKPLSYFKHKNRPAQANGLTELQINQTNHSVLASVRRTQRKSKPMRPLVHYRPLKPSVTSSLPLTFMKHMIVFELDVVSSINIMQPCFRCCNSKQ